MKKFLLIALVILTLPLSGPFLMGMACTSCFQSDE